MDPDGDLRVEGTIGPCSTRAEFSDVKRSEESLSKESALCQARRMSSIAQGQSQRRIRRNDELQQPVHELDRIAALCAIHAGLCPAQ